MRDEKVILDELVVVKRSIAEHETALSEARQREHNLTAEALSTGTATLGTVAAYCGQPTAAVTATFRREVARRRGELGPHGGARDGTGRRPADLTGTILTSAAIARLAGVTRATVSNWKQRHPDFPAPVPNIEPPQYTRASAIAWLTAHGKIRPGTD